jgi:sterol 3beta-glucosyltransferase
MTTVGTEGDIRPFIAVALALVRDHGHQVTIATHVDFEEMIRSRGLRFRVIGGSFKKVVESPEGRAWIESSDSLLRYLRLTRQTFDGLMTAWGKDTLAAVQDADAVLAHPFTMAAIAGAEKKKKPAMVLALPPFVESGELEAAFFLGVPKWKWLRRALGRFQIRGIGQILVPHLNVIRKAEGLEPLPSPMFIDDGVLAKKIPILHLFSEALVKRPLDWPELAQITGFCFLEEDGWTAPDDLVAFVGEDPQKAPLYIGFGSMTGKEPKALAELTIGAVRRANERAVLVTGWGGAPGLSADPNVYVTNRVSHDWLLPRSRAVVHHGGAGTTAAGLRAARPTQVVAFFGDQPYWGHRVFKNGAGPYPILRRNVTEEALSDAMKKLVAEPAYKEGAKRIAALMANEDGAKTTAAKVQSYLRSFVRSQ